MNRIIRKFKRKIRIFLTLVIGNSFDSIKKKKLDNVSIVSFDVFDTLIIRPGIKCPTDVFDLINPRDINFKTKRIQAEINARSKSKLEDIKLSDIYNELFPENSQSAREFEKKEINTELSICKANSEALELYNRIKSSGKRIIIVSDMYLQKDIIEKILNKCSYDTVGVPIYVSSEYGKTKRKGSLYKEVLLNLDVDANKVMHIGDNLISDYYNAKKYGIVGCLYNKK